jgi:hypothetical protein
VADLNPQKKSSSRDTSPLDPEQLSDDELAIVNDIESRLAEEPDAQAEDAPLDLAYLHRAEIRHPRVLLLDGGRGTGKTSLLLTLVKRWHHNLYGDKGEKQMLAAWDSRDKGRIIPANVRALPISDFDPLPPDMPLIAGLVEAWRPLASKYEELSGSTAGYDGDRTTLMDQWHRLFQVAAGWSPTSKTGGLIDHVLEQQEHVKDWKLLDQQWRTFVDAVFEQGKRLPLPHRLPSNTVFVLIVDDVDLQVKRIRELLPAIRLLRHPRVVFLVAADKGHMLEMLSLDFLGQQGDLIPAGLGTDPNRVEVVEEWSGVLARSSFHKVFELRNQFTLRPLSAFEFLNFPRNSAVTLGSLLESRVQEPTAQEQRDRVEKPAFGGLGSYLRFMFDDPTVFPDLVPYRFAHQIFEQAQRSNNPDDAAVTAVRHLIGTVSFDDSVKIRKAAQGGSRDTIEYPAQGELTALWSKGFTERIDHEGEIVLSAQARFNYRQGSSLSGTPKSADRRKLAPLLLAISLRDDGYGVLAPNLRWNVALALAWTIARIREGASLSFDLAFRWQLHEHPSPLRLLNWTKEWRGFVDGLSANTLELIDRSAYAWLYYQLLWLRKTPTIKSEPTTLSKGLPVPLDSQFGNGWDELLQLVPETGSDAERQRWRSRTLPLMARPELGLPRDVQERILNVVKDKADIEWLKVQRRRYITDAIVAFDQETGRQTIDAESQEKADSAAQLFERRHLAVEKRPSPWAEYIEKGSAGGAS